jgi:pimeloyl-ACP methyl ester carboxylesterase
MAQQRWTKFALGALGIAAAIAGGVTYARFRRDLRAARARLDNVDHRTVDTAAGPIEVGTWGKGPTPVLSIHGIMGGFDQGVMLAQGWLDPDRFHVIAPSRFGYPGTPMPDGDASPAAQADAFAALLDTLEIDRVGVIATSAGGTSALQVALRHPDRCAGLVLVSSNAPSAAPGAGSSAAPPRPVIETMFGSNAIFWLLTAHLREQLYPIIGIPRSYTVKPQDLDAIDEVMTTLLPVKPRAAGAVHDLFVSNPAINDGYPLESITADALVIGARDDPLASYGDLKAMADRLPNARMLTVDEGGHMLLGDDGRVPREIQAFLDERAARP